MTVRRVKGVRAVAEELQVQYAFEPKKSDDQIAKRVADILEWDPLVPRGLEVTVEKGVVKLSGKVEWNYQRDLAAEDTAKITGVVRIDNRIQVAPPISTTDIINRIEQAFERNADLEAEKIHVQAQGAKVTLTGSVSSWNKRYLAESAAWSAPGVIQVEDRLMVA
jgi:osmotically-inducible protein OsmY